MGRPLPVTVLVGGSLYAVNVEDMAGETANAGNRVMQRGGDCNTTANIIRIHSEVLEPERTTILVHELLHAMWAQTNLPVRNEERIVAALAPVITATLRANPELVRFLIGSK